MWVQAYGHSGPTTPRPIATPDPPWDDITQINLPPDPVQSTQQHNHQSIDPPDYQSIDPPDATSHSEDDFDPFKVYHDFCHLNPTESEGDAASMASSEEAEGDLPMCNTSWCEPCEPPPQPLRIPSAPISYEHVPASSWEREGDTLEPTVATVEEELYGATVSVFGLTAQSATAMPSAQDLPALMEPVDLQAEDFGGDTPTIGIDNRASLCISGFEEDFEGNLSPCNKPIEGVSGTNSRATHTGTIKWTFYDDDGEAHTSRMPNSLYIPGCPHRLFSPQHWAQSAPKSPTDPIGPICITTKDRTVLYWDHMTKHKIVPRDKQNVFTFRLSPNYNEFTALCAAQSYNPQSYDANPPTFDPVAISSTSPDTPSDVDSEGEKQQFPEKQQGPADSHPADRQPNSIDMFDLCPVTADSNDEEHSEGTMDKPKENPSAELLRYHYKYNHISFRRLQEMAKAGIIPARLANCPVPHCPSCSYGKATRKSKQTKTKRSVNPPKEVNKPGDCVSVDVMVTTTPGLIAQMAGFLTRQRYKYACVFVDHHSDLGFIHLLKEQTAEALLEAKQAFESYSDAAGVDIKHYHADNGIFAAKAWKQACAENHQGLTFAGVNSHHQNGRAERRIRSIQDQARTTLIHGNSRWPDAITPNLWPYAVRMASEMLNNTPCARHHHKHTPMQIFTRTRVETNPRHQIPLFCPAYVLDSKLQKGESIDKWKARATLGIYIGRSPIHARSVALVLNLKTGRVSPQFHVQFDPSFGSVMEQGANVPKSLWQVACGLKGSKSSLKMFSRSGHDQEPTFIGDSDSPETMEQAEQADETPGKDQAPKVKFEQDSPDEPIVIEDEDEPTTEEREGDAKPPQQSTDDDQSSPPAFGEPGWTRRTSARQNLGTRGPKFQEVYNQLGSAKAMMANTGKVEGEIFSTDNLCPNPVAMAASSDPDVMYYHEAMKQPDHKQFKEAAHKEFDDTLDKGILKLVKRTSVPAGTKIFKSVWAMRRKRRIMSQEIYKWKARLNFDGSKQIKDQDYDQSYAPVASWESIRILLSLVLRNNWHTLQLDFVQAYPQAPADREYYMEIPPGMEGPRTEGMVLKVEKNIYGQVQASRVWNLYLVDKLKSIGFKQSEHDECVFYKGNAIYVLYTDDSILAGPDKDELNAIYQEMKNTGLDMTMEDGGLSDFLGVNIERINETTFHLSQPHLIEKIVSDLGLQGNNVAIKDTPAQTNKVLSAHLDSEPFDQHFHYRSIIGKLNHLERCTRPDIAYAVHQCARFSANPRKEHGQAVKWLGRYLRGTHDKGIFLKLDDNNFEVWADADFAGNWVKEDAPWDKDTARSRSGYVIKYLGVPILWKSQLQDTWALSTTEAEYICLSQALRKTIPIMRLVEEMAAMGYPVGSTRPKILCTAFQDNSGALTLAKLPAMRPRTKYLNCKYHHFRSFVPDKIDIDYCNTDDMMADTLTKPNPAMTLQKHRKSIMGW